MSLHGKVVAWFVIFAALTVGLFVLGDHFQSTHALRAVLEARAGALASQAAHEVERRYDRAESTLLAFGYARLDGDTDVSPVDRFSSVRVFDGDSLAWSYYRDPSLPAPGCGAREILFSVPVMSPSGRVQRLDAAMPAAEFFEGVTAVSARLGRGGTTTVLAQGAEVVYDQGCLLESPDLPRQPGETVRVHGAIALAAGHRARGVMATDGPDGGDYLLGMARLERPDWAVVAAVDFPEFAAPFARVRNQYLGVTLAAVLLALVVIILMIRNDMRRLHVIAQAADSIGRGQFNVWLPPPTRDDVGRLSMALGRMANRLSTTMHQMEVTRAMAAVGELASYLSHEIRNPLSSIRMNLQMLGRDLGKGKAPDDGDELVRVCLAELQRLDDVVKAVLDVGRHTPAPRDASCDAHHVLHETLKVLRPKLAAHGVAADIRLGAVRSDVAVDAKLLKSVLINLFLNAADAMAESEERRILVTTELRGIWDQGAVLEMRVMDTGPGVPAHLQTRIFEPFFTTKASGNGIGLATALRIMQECGGVLRCEPRSGWTGGAEFVMELPLAVSGRRGSRTPELVEAG